MAYRKPGTYARFVRSASAVSNAGSTRYLALVGTGLNYFEVSNEVVTRASDKPYDELKHSNVMEILSVSSKPIYYEKNTPNNVIYTINDYSLKDGKNIVWRTLNTIPDNPTLVKVDGTDPFVNEGSKEFNKFINIVTDANTSYLVEDGEWMIEVTYAAKEGGCYRVINYETKELIGEYAVSEDYKSVIPGCQLTITSTYRAPDNATPESEDNLISVGDYVVFKTVAGKTEIEPKAAVDTVSSNMSSYVSKLEIVNQGAVTDGTYDVVVVKASTKEYQVKKGSLVIYPEDGVSTATWVDGLELYQIIPGVSVTFKDLDANIVDGQFVRFVTTARVVDTALPGEGDTFYVSYKYRKPDADYAAKIFFEYDDVVAEYGNYDVTASGFVLNSLSLGAEIAFTNGLTQVICVQAKGTSDLEFTNAIDALKRELPGVDNVNVVIPLSTSVDVGTALMNHVDLMSSYEVGKERMGYFGAYINQALTKNPTAKDRTIGMVETAESFVNERMVFVTPGEIVKDIRDIRTGRTNERTLPACYPAIAVAAKGLVNDPAEPLTNKTIAGFKYIPTTLMESEKNLLASAGCLVLEQRGASVIKIRHGITTSTTEVNSQEITLIQIKDYVIDACRKATNSLYVGLKNRPSVLADVQYTITSILNQFVSQEVLIGYSGLSVKRSSDDPRQIDVKFEIEAVYPLNYINITFGFSAVS